MIRNYSFAPTIALFMIASACASAPDSPTEEQVKSASPAPEQSPQQKAADDVARLTAEAQQDVLLAPWTGPHGGVPPWDKVKAELFSPAFTKSLALLQAEIDAIAEDPA